MLLVVIFSNTLHQFNHTSHTHHLSVLQLSSSTLLSYPSCEAQSIATRRFANPCHALPPLLIASSIIPKHSFLSFSLLDISVVYAAVRLIFPLRRTYVPFIFLLDIVIVFMCVHLWCVLLRCSALVEVRSGEDKISRDVYTINNNICITSRCLALQRSAKRLTHPLNSGVLKIENVEVF